MASSFPGSLDSFTDPTASDKLSSPNHAVLHQDVNDAIEKVETKLGTGSATPSSGAVLVGNGAGTSTWDTSPNNLTFDTPTLNTPDLNGTELILDADADTSITADTDDQIDIKVAGADDFRIAANNFTALSGSKFTSDRIDELTASSLILYDSSGNEYLAFSRTASAVNLLTIANAATANAPSISATGDDANIDINFVPKGTGVLKVSGTAFTGAWSTWTPTWTNLTVGNGTLTARYIQIGKTVRFSLKLVFGSTTAVTGADPTFSLPVTSIASYVPAGFMPIGLAGFNDSSAGGAITNGAVTWQTTTTASIVAFVSSGTYVTESGIAAAVPYAAWATGDSIFLSGSYEAA